MHPSAPRPIRIVFVLATIGALLAFPGLTSAAPKGSDVTFTVAPLITAVSPGRDGAFEALVHNGGNATLTHATLTATVAGGASAVSPPGCAGFPTITCDLGSLSSGDSRTLVFVVTGAATASSIEMDATLQVDAGGGNPSLDEFTDLDNFIAVNSSSSFFGTWQGANARLIGSVGSIGGSGHQIAHVDVPGVQNAYAASVVEVGGSVCGVTGIGQGVSMALADGAIVAPYLIVTITYDAEARGNRTPGNVKVIHDSDCEAPLVAGCDTAGCFNAWWEGNGRDKLLVVEARLPHNGIVKGF